MTLAFCTCDVFTTERYSGNPLAVVSGADGLSGSAMQRIAGEFNLSETIFILTAQDAAHTARVRIFTPGRELPFAGHPTVGCAVMLAENAAGEGDFETIVTLEEQAGLVPVTVWRRGGRVTATLTAPLTPFAVDASITAMDAAVALGLSPADIGFGPHRCGVAEAGPRFIFVPVSNLDALSRATPNGAAFEALMAQGKTHEVFVYTAGTEGADYRGRMFAPDIGIPEDPATGAASACFPAHLDACGLLTDGTTDLVMHQGYEMGRPSRIAIGIDRAQGTIAAVRVGGSAIRVSSGTLEPPAP